MLNKYSYQAALAASESIHWRIEDIIGGEKRLDFTQAVSCPSRWPKWSRSRFFNGGETNSESDQRQCVPLHLRTRRGIHSSIRPGPCSSAITMATIIASARCCSSRVKKLSTSSCSNVSAGV